MRNRFFYRRRAERFAQLLDEANGARRHHVRTSVDDELSGLVEFGQRIRAGSSAVAADPAFRDGLRAMLIATAQREGIGRTEAAGAANGRGGAKPAATQPHFATGPAGTATRMPPPRRTRRLRPLLNGQSSRVRARGAIVLGVAAGAIAVSGMSAASENALPGDALYGMKRSTERAQLALAASDLSRGQLFLDFARTRLTEAEALRGDVDGFAAVLDDMDAETRQGVRLLTTAAMQRGDGIPLDAVIAFVDGQRRQVAGLAGTVATRAERGRAEASRDLLDQVRKRTEGLRAALACGAGSSPHTDNLGPSPRPCAPQRLPGAEPRPGLSRHEESGRRSAEPSRTGPDGAPQGGAPADPAGPPDDARIGLGDARTSGD